MIKTINLIIVLLVLIPCYSYSQNGNLQQFDFLIGTWKIEGKESYETWEKKKDRLTGYSYKIKNGQKVISENIELKMVENQIIYTATVLDQNDGKGIPFKLKLLEHNLFSFENPKHDFPKKIQYQIISDNELFVLVLGENDRGFSYKLIRQPN